MLVDSRISLFLIYPGLSSRHSAISMSAMEADADIGDSDDDPFAGDVNFGVLVNETGGKLFFNRNDVDAEIARSEQMGANYYTLTYQPDQGGQDGKFRRIRVTLRDHNLRAVTKAGYYALDEHGPIDQRQQDMTNIAEAAQSTIPLAGLHVTLADVVRHPDTHTAEFTVQLRSKNLSFFPMDDGRYAASLTMAAVSLDANQRIEASRMKNVTVVSPTRDPAGLPEIVSSFEVKVRIPQQTQTVRVVLEDKDDGLNGRGRTQPQRDECRARGSNPRASDNQTPEGLRQAPIQLEFGMRRPLLNSKGSQTSAVKHSKNPNLEGVSVQDDHAKKDSKLPMQKHSVLN